MLTLGEVRDLVLNVFPESNTPRHSHQNGEMKFSEEVAPACASVRVLHTAILGSGNDQHAPRERSLFGIRISGSMGDIGGGCKHTQSATR